MPDELPHPDEGIVTLETPGMTYRLRPTPDAMMKVCEACGSVGEAVERLLIRDADGAAIGYRGDFKVMLAVAEAGTAVRPGGREVLRKALFEAGVEAATPPLLEFLLILSRGGRRAVPDETAADSGDEGNA